MDSSTTSHKPSLANRNRRHQLSNAIKLGDIVTFIYDSRKVHGTAEFIGRTDFSSNILCGVALVEKLGKHNGTVKGRYYFKCPDKHGVFVPLRKVSPVQGLFREKIKKRLESITSIEDNKEEDKEVEEEVSEKEIEDDMRITVRSFKAPQKISTTLDSESLHPNKKEASSPRHIKTTNNSCSDSGVESPTDQNSIEIERIINQSHKAYRSPYKKGVVVSSFIAESPKKPVLFNSFDEDSGQQSGLLTNSLDEKEIPLKTKTSKETPSVKGFTTTRNESTIDESSALSVDVFVREANTRPSSDKPSSNGISLLATAKQSSQNETALDKRENENTSISNENENELDGEDGTTSKIPRHVSAATKQCEFNFKKEAKASPSLQHPSIKPTTSPVKRISRLATPSSTTNSKLRRPSVPLTKSSTHRKASISTTESSSSPSSATSLRLSSTKLPTATIKASSGIQRRSSTKKSESVVHKGKMETILHFHCSFSKKLYNLT